MYGWRARIGMILPSPAATGPEEYRRIAPEGVAFLTSRVLVEKLEQDSIDRGVDQLERAAKELATAGVECIIQQGTGLGFYRGYGFDKQMIERIKSATGLPATTQMTASVDALRRFNLKRIAVATPYNDALKGALKKFLEDSGFEVMTIQGLGHSTDYGMQQEPPYASYRIAKKIYFEAPDCDGIFVACSTWRTMESIRPLEIDTGKPVVSSTQAALWAVLNMAMVREPIMGYGKLLESF